MASFQQDPEIAKTAITFETNDEISSVERRPTNTVLLRLNRAEIWLNEKLNIETGGIDRVLESDKKPPSIWVLLLFYWGSTCHIGVVSIGLVGPLLGFSLGQSAIGIFVGAMIGSLFPAYCATLGPLTGLRAIATSRYSFGFWGAKLCAVLNIFVCGSYLIINVITVSQILSAVSGYRLSLSVGSIIIGVISYLVSVFGFHVVYKFEKYSWIVPFILLCILVGQAAPHLGPSVSTAGSPSAGTWLSFFAVTISAASSWCSIIADYYCHFPASTKRLKVFSLTWIGVVLPTAFTIMIGACVGHAAITTQYPPYAEALKNHGFGGLVHEIYRPAAWANFCLVILSFTVLGNNVVVIYSSGLSMQFLGHSFHAVPRLIWSLLFTVATVILAVAGKDNLTSIVSNAVALLGYWGIGFSCILFIEDQWFRKGHPEVGYDLSVWNQARHLPPGVAAITALIAGYLGGGLTGMAQTWYVGPIAAKIGQTGGDLGIYLTAIITSFVYCVLRFAERKLVGR